MSVKRKVIQLAGKTLVVSLPVKWAKEQGIKKGDEIELIEQGSIIQLTKELPTHLSKSAVEIDVSNKKEMVKRMIASLYKAGVDEICMKYSSSQELDKLKEVLTETCSGFEIYVQTAKYVEIKNISKIDESQFDQFLKRTFHIMHTMADDVLKGIETKDGELLFDVFSRDLTVNKLTDLCRRLINKNAYKGKNKEALYFLIEQLEKIADIFKDMGKTLSTSEKIIVSKKNQDLLKESIELFRMISDLFYTFSWEKIQTFRLKRDILTKKIEGGFAEFPREDLRLLSRIDLLVQQVYDMHGALIAYQVEL